MSNYFDNKKKTGGLRLKDSINKSSYQKPLISIITCVLNGEKYLEETILSIRNQTYKNYEYIIIDGGSSDSTLSIIKRNEDIITYWQSEKDEGLYFGFNKGLKERGIETFNDLFELDDNWDETNEINRVNIFASKLIEWNNKSIEEIKEIYNRKDIQDRLNSNYNLATNAFCNFEENLINELK